MCDPVYKKKKKNLRMKFKYNMEKTLDIESLDYITQLPLDRVIKEHAPCQIIWILSSYRMSCRRLSPQTRSERDQVRESK